MGLGQRDEVRVAQRGGRDPARVFALLVHADRPQHAVVDDDHDHRGAVLHRGGELLRVHHEAAVAGEADHVALRRGQLGGDRRRQPVAHRAVGRRQFGRRAAVAVEAVHPDRVVAGAVGDDGVVGQRRPDVGDDRGEVDAVAGERRRGDVGQVLGARRACPVGPARRCGRHRQRGQRLRGGRSVGFDRQRRPVHAAEFGRVGVDVDQRLPRLRCVDQGVAGAADFAQPRTEHQQQVGVAHALQQGRRSAEAELADVVLAAVVEQVLAAKAGDHRQRARRGERVQRVAPGALPARSADDEQRTLRRGQPLLQFGQRGSARGDPRGRRHGRCVGDVRDVGAGVQQVVGQHDDDRAGAPAARHRVGTGDGRRELVDAARLRDPFGDGAEHRRVVDFLERLAAEESAVDLADEQDHRRRILARGVQPVARVRRSGAPRDETQAGFAGQLAVGVGHVRRRAFVARDHGADRRRRGQRVEHRQEALAGDAIDEFGAFANQRVDQDLAAVAGCGSGHRG
ncbi:hypothetical protein GALL_382800 [mine drainage metagenome]|uniref:Uncharacterized protein n=1 Tax=mine drainage metagenome TaxID=410659 RepID=A0A1J5Q8H7_9ZZZZ